MADKTVHDALVNAKSVMFIKPEDNNEIATVFVIFEDLNFGLALYTEVDRVNKIKPQYLGFKRSHSSMILSFIIKATNIAHAKMLLDYDPKEFNDFIEVVKPTDQYILVFGNIQDGERRIGMVGGSPVTFYQYLLE